MPSLPVQFCQNFTGQLYFDRVAFFILLLHFFFITVFSSFSIFMLHLFRVALCSCCTFFVLNSFHVAPFPVLHYLHIALFPCCTNFILPFFCCTYFMMHFLRVVLFSCCNVMCGFSQNKFSGKTSERLRLFHMLCNSCNLKILLNHLLPNSSICRVFLICKDTEVRKESKLPLNAINVLLLDLKSMIRFLYTF